MLVPDIAASAPRETTCALRGSSTILATRDVRVATAADGRYFACRYGGRPMRLAAFAGQDGGPTHFTAHGPVVAYAQVDGDHLNADDPKTVHVRVVDLRRRSTREQSFRDVGGVGGLVLRGRTVAFMLRRQHVLASNVSRVLVWRPGRRPVTVDAGDGIDEASLALAGRTLFWLKDATARSARLD